MKHYSGTKEGQRTIARKRKLLAVNQGPSKHKQVNMAYARSGKVKPKYRNQ